MHVAFFSESVLIGDPELTFLKHFHAQDGVLVVRACPVANECTTETSWVDRFNAWLNKLLALSGLDEPRHIDLFTLKLERFELHLLLRDVAESLEDSPHDTSDEDKYRNEDQAHEPPPITSRCSGTS